MAALGFTPASQQDVFSIERERPRCKTSSALSGEDARQFYENVMNDDKGKDLSVSASIRKDNDRQRRTRPKIRESKRETRTSERSMELQGLRLLHCAHEGDISGLKELLLKGVDINFQDTFFWTAIMCASWSGQRAAVRLLLQHGAAWVGVVDTQGRDAQDLAQEAGHTDVLEELESYGRSTQRFTQTESRLGSSSSSSSADVSYLRC
uniref:G patch domain and ankyrin repeats 1 n=1 Tax=Mastacembelus armatus TaxID=205130 RepID=A0A3Q3LTH9_9TELE